MNADYDVSEKLNKMFINQGESKMSEREKEISQTGNAEIFEELRTATVKLLECHSHLQRFLADRDMLLRQGRKVLDKLHDVVCESADGFNSVTQEYIELQDAYINLLETKEKYQN